MRHSWQIPHLIVDKTWNIYIMLQPTILLVDNDLVFLQTTAEFLEGKGYPVICASTLTEAREILKQRLIALAIIDYRLGDDNDNLDKTGLKLAQAAADLNVPAIILTKFQSYEYAVEALRPEKGVAAAVDFVSKQERLEKLLESIEHALTKSRIFLCYANPDKRKITTLYRNLTLAGFYPWMDKKSIHGGEKWELAIRKAIRSSDFFIICLSKNSVNRRGFMQKEIKIALDIWDEKLEDDIFMIPVRLEDCVITHEKLLELQWIDLYKADGFTKLVRAIREGCKRRS